MTSTVEELVTFFRSDYWAENIDLMHRSDLTLHEVMLSTSVHPVTLEFLFDRYLAAMGKDVVNVGHAVVGNRGLVKYYTADRPSFFLMWTYGEDSLIGPDPDGATVLLGDAGERSYLDDVIPRRINDSDHDAIDRYFASEHWDEMLGKMRDPDIEHFHDFLLTEIHPYDLAERCTDAIRDAGYGEVEPYYLPRPDIGSMWIGYAPPGTKSMEFVATHTPGAVLEPQELTDADRAYGGDGFTVSQLREFIAKDPYRPVTLSEARAVLAEVLRP